MTFSPKRSRMRLAAAICLVVSLGTAAAASAPATAASPVFPVLVIETSGGFIPPKWAMLRTPRVAVYSDGSVFATMDVTTMIYPGPAAPSIQRKVGASTLRILAAADAANVTNPKFDWGIPPVADAPDTVFRIQRSPRGPVITTTIYALGIGDYGLTKEQSAARSAAERLVTRLQSFDNTLIPTKSLPSKWTASRWVYSAQPMGRDEFSVVRPWVSTKPLAETPLCNDLTAAENRKLVSLLPRLNQSSRWTSDKRLWATSLRPLFPHETGCAALNYASGW